MLNILRRALYTNQHLTPHKLILVYTEERNELSKALVLRIQKELRDVYLNAMETDRVIDSSQVPFTVFITKRTMMDGVVELQHYNPKIREEVHVSNLTERLLLQAGHW